MAVFLYVPNGIEGARLRQASEAPEHRSPSVVGLNEPSEHPGNVKGDGCTLRHVKMKRDPRIFIGTGLG